MRMGIRIRLDGLGGASVGRVVIQRGGGGTALVDGAVPPASSMILWVMVVMRIAMVGIMRGPACASSDSSAVTAVPGAGADEAPTPALNIGNISPANPLSIGYKIDKSWSSSTRS